MNWPSRCTAAREFTMSRWPLYSFHVGNSKPELDFVASRNSAVRCWDLAAIGTSWNRAREWFARDSLRSIRFIWFRLSLFRFHLTSSTEWHWIKKTAPHKVSECSGSPEVRDANAIRHKFLGDPNFREFFCGIKNRDNRIRAFCKIVSDFTPYFRKTLLAKTRSNRM